MWNISLRNTTYLNTTCLNTTYLNTTNIQKIHTKTVISTDLPPPVRHNICNVANTCHATIRSQTIIRSKHIKISSQNFVHNFDVITGQGITKQMFLYSFI